MENYKIYFCMLTFWRKKHQKPLLKSEDVYIYCFVIKYCAILE